MTHCKPLTTGKHCKALNGVHTVEIQISMEAKKKCNVQTIILNKILNINLLVYILWYTFQNHSRINQYFLQARWINSTILWGTRTKKWQPKYYHSKYVDITDLFPDNFCLPELLNRWIYIRFYKSQDTNKL